MLPFKDRSDAGQLLAESVVALNLKRPLVMALPRGGVPVGAEIAKVLSCPLDIIVARKIGAPFNPEFAVGAVAWPDILVLENSWIKAAGTSRAAVEGVVEKETHELERRMTEYRSGAWSAGYVPESVVIVDDGVATGFTAKAACMAARAKYPKARIVFATPVDLSEKGTLRGIADDVVILTAPKNIFAIGQAYQEFPQLSDKDVLSYLKR